MKKIQRWYRDNQTTIYQASTCFLLSGLGITLIALGFEKEKFHQVEEAVEDLGLTSTIVNHMNTFGPF